MENRDIIEKKQGSSIFTSSTNLIDEDPFEEIFALNLGDFLTEHLINDDFAQMIAKNKTDNSDKVKNIIQQLDELISIYSINNTLNILGLSNEKGILIYNAIAQTIAKMTDSLQCHIFLTKQSVEHNDNNDSKELLLVGSSDDKINNNISNLSYNFDLNVEYNISEVFNDKKTIKLFDKYLLNNEIKYKYTIISSMHNNIETIGVIVVQKNTEEDYCENTITLLEAIGKLFATSMHLQKIINEVKYKTKDKNVSISKLKHLRAELTSLICDLGIEQQNFVKILAINVNSKDVYKTNHCQIVANLSLEIAKNLGLNEKTIDLIYYAGLLQNIGKIILPKKLLQKNSKLNNEEIQTLKNCNNLGVSLLMNINFLSEIIPYVLYKGERWDGSGVPEGLKGNGIPLGSRIIAVADAFCALTSDRPHRKKLSKTQAIDILKSETNSKWDPKIIMSLIEVTKNI